MYISSEDKPMPYKEMGINEEIEEMGIQFMCDSLAFATMKFEGHLASAMPVLQTPPHYMPAGNSPHFDLCP